MGEAVLVTDADRALRGYGRAWRRAVAPGMAGLCCGPEWSAAVWRHIPPLGAPWVLVYQDCGAVTILPMSVVDDEGRRRVVFAGGPLIDAGDALSTAAEPVDHTRRLLAATRAFLRPGDWLDLRPVYPDSHLARALAAGAVDGFTARCRRAGTSPRMTAAPAVPRRRPGPKLRGQLRRRWAALAARGQLDWHRTTSPSTVDIRNFLDRRRAQWQARGRLGELPYPQHEPAFADFVVQAVTRPEGSAAAAVLDLLCVDGVVVASDLYLQCGDHRLQYLRQFDPGYARYSPGHLLLWQSLQPGRQAGVDLLDFGQGGEQWKYDFGAVDSDLIHITLTAS